PRLQPTGSRWHGRPIASPRPRATPISDRARTTMAIKEGDAIPDVKLTEMVDGKPSQVSLADLSRGKRVVVFAVPGAFTPTCSLKHLPGFVDQEKALRAKGADEIVCISVNDAFVMDAWGKSSSASG